jgi:hypothetical protein
MTHDEIGHIFIARRLYSNLPDVPLFRAVERDTDHYMAVAKVRERLAVSKTAFRVDIEMFNLKKLNEVEGKEQYRVEI